VHGVSPEALDVDAMIEEDVPIIAIVVETLQVGGVLQVLLEFHDKARGIRVIVYEEARTCTEIDIWSHEGLRAYNLSVTHWTLLFCIYFYSLSIPGMDAVRH
jgi:hypothetical protein